MRRDFKALDLLSLSARRAWIEINYLLASVITNIVALRKESVDRNALCRRSIRRYLAVALRKESVDRNTNPGSTTLTFPGSLSARRAWIEMCFTGWKIRSMATSLSARRAWIEITTYFDTSSIDDLSLSARRAWIEIYAFMVVALLAIGSLSARRAWIEMPMVGGSLARLLVALRKESVDRNIMTTWNIEKTVSRSPQGERG